MIAEMKTCDNCKSKEKCSALGIPDINHIGTCTPWEAVPPKFGPCVKCGCESILMQYSDGKTHRVGEIFHVPAMECEHQDCRCGQCGYTWEQVCVDSTEKKGE